VRHDDECKIADKLVEIHGWAHRCLLGLSKEELYEAHELGNEILTMLNDRHETTNGIKFIALFEALAVGADVMQNEMDMLHRATGTVH